MLPLCFIVRGCWAEDVLRPLAIVNLHFRFVTVKYFPPSHHLKQ